MASFYRLTKHPITGKWEKALWMDNYYGHYHYGVRFEDGTIVNPELLELETKDKKAMRENQQMKKIWGQGSFNLKGK